MSGSGRPRPAALLATGAAILAVAGIAAATLSGDEGEAGGRAVGGGGSTVAVTRQTLVERETVQGTLGYAGNRTVLNRLAVGGSAAGGGGTPSNDTSAVASTATTTVAATATTPVASTATTCRQAHAESQLLVDKVHEPPPSGRPRDETPSEDSPSCDDRSADDRAGDDRSGDDRSDGDRPDGDDRSGDDPSAGSPSGGSSSPDAPTRGNPSGDTPPGDTPSGDASSSGDGSGAGGSGTATALARPGSVVRRGGALYRLDGDPVVLMYGSTPAYRDLAPGVEDGRDVRQLERNLTELGFDPGTVDDSFTSTTAAAVADWQEAAGLPDTGTVELGRVVFLPGARRVGEHKTTVGSVLSAGAEVLETSSTKRVVTVELDAALQDLARKGDRVEVTLPNQSTVRGRIAGVGRVAREKESSGGDAGAPTGEEKELVIDVTVRLRSARGLGRLDEAPVSVGLAQESRRNVLAVPVNALVARRGGGYGLELAAGRRIVPVRAGLFAGGYVEVSGSGIREGTRVVVPDG